MVQVTTKSGTGRDVGRPRSFSDEDAFRATTRLLIEHGASGITLADLARDLGCTAPALNVRFGSRIGLLKAYYAWATQMDSERFRRVRGEFASPMAAVRARFTLPAHDRLEELVDSTGQAKLLSLLSEAQADPEFADLVAERSRIFERELTDLLRAAIDAGELEPCDPAGLAHLLYTSFVGASFIWSVKTHGSVLDELMGVLDTALAPCLTESGKAAWESAGN
jgi:AcrR family transcriptional regulator